MERIGDFFTHLGWAFWGQECDCGANPFNGFARYMQTLLPESDWDDERDNYRHWWQRGICALGTPFYNLGVWLYWPPDSTEE